LKPPIYLMLVFLAVLAACESSTIKSEPPQDDCIEHRGGEDEKEKEGGIGGTGAREC